MNNFIVYDLIFLAVFALFATIFISKRRRHIKRQGWILLYHTKLGLVLMDRWAKKYARFLRPLQYVIVTVGYILLVAMSWLLVRTVYEYVSSPFLARALKIPPLLPLFPYFPQIFKVESLFPPFYFTYFLLAIAVVAIGHEFAHGLFARLNKVRIKSTGIAFFGPFFGAFVEQDDRDMKKIKKFPQLAILAAGVFVNVLLTIIFGLVLALFFVMSFAPTGVIFNTYSTAVVNTSSITDVNGVPMGLLDLASPQLNESLIEIRSGNTAYFVPGSAIRTALEKEVRAITVYEDSPAYRAQLASPIIAIDGVPTRTLTELRSVILSHQPGDEITITTVQGDAYVDQRLVLAERDNLPFIGIGVNKAEQRGLRGMIAEAIYAIKDPFTYYEPVWGGDFAWFLYYLLWWIVMINLLVALFNMLPLGMLDGGRFFYLTIWGLTGKEKWGRRAFKWASAFFLALLALMMVRWVFAFI